jgi:RNA polymerase sigma factor (sigma-70 family)
MVPKEPGLTMPCSLDWHLPVGLLRGASRVLRETAVCRCTECGCPKRDPAPDPFVVIGDPVSKQMLGPEGNEAVRKIRVGKRFWDPAALAAELDAGNEVVLRDLVLQVRANRAAGAGRPVVLDFVCRSFSRQVRTFLRNKFFQDDATLVEEVWNETLQRVYQRIDRFDSTRSKFSTWLLNQAQYASLDRLRERQRIRAREVLTAPKEIARPQADPAAIVIEEVEGAALRRAFPRMSSLDQEVLVLRHLLGCRFVEIARHRLAGDLPEEHVRVYANRASKRLIKLFEEELATPSSSPSQALKIDELVPIQLVAERARASGEYEQLDCVAADVAAAEVGRVLRQCFDSSMLNTDTENRYGRELEKHVRALPAEEIDAFTDEEAEAVLAEFGGRAAPGYY